MAGKNSGEKTNVKTSEVLKAQAFGIRQSERYSITTGMTPDRLVAILDDAANGDTANFVQMADEMEEKDGQIASKLQTRRLALLGVGYSVKSGDDSDFAAEIADVCRKELIEKPIFRGALLTLQDAISKGFGVVQPVYDTTRAIWSPVKYATPDLRWFQFNSQDLSELRIVHETQQEGVALPPDTFVCHYAQNKPGYPCRTGLARVCSISWMLKALATKDWAGFVEVFGVPLRVGRYHPGGVNDEVLDQFKTAISSLGSDAACLIPKGVLDLEILDGRGAVGSNSGAGGPHDTFVRWQDEQIAKIIHGQTLTSDAGASLSQGRVHADVAQDYLEADGLSLAATIQDQLIAQWVGFNYGPEAPQPIFSFNTDPPEDLRLWTDITSAWVDRGVRVRESDVLDKLGLDPVDDTDPIISDLMAAAQQPESITLSEEDA